VSWFEQPGLVLFTEDYPRCLAFYRDLLELPVLFASETVTALKFGDGYIMVEGGGTSAPPAKSRAQSPITLRFNVADVDERAQWLRSKGIAIDVSHWDWGTIGTFTDPDGNRCELRNHFDGTFAPKR
jgi:lactoylglutathione lyase